MENNVSIMQLLLICKKCIFDYNFHVLNVCVYFSLIITNFHEAMKTIFDIHIIA